MLQIWEGTWNSNSLIHSIGSPLAVPLNIGNLLIIFFVKTGLILELNVTGNKGEGERASILVLMDLLPSRITTREKEEFFNAKM